MKWEYKVIKICSEGEEYFGEEEWTKVLNKYGAECWELVSVIWQDVQMTVAFFKRQKND